MVQFARSKATATSAAWLSKSSNSFRSRNASPSMANPLLTSSVFYQPTKGGQFTTETPDSPIDLFRPPTPRAKADVHPGELPARNCSRPNGHGPLESSPYGTLARLPARL